MVRLGMGPGRAEGPVTRYVAWILACMLVLTRCVATSTLSLSASSSPPAGVLDYLFVQAVVGPRPGDGDGLGGPESKYTVHIYALTTYYKRNDEDVSTCKASTNRPLRHLARVDRLTRHVAVQSTEHVARPRMCTRSARSPSQ